MIKCASYVRTDATDAPLFHQKNVVAFPQSAGALWQSDVNRLQSLKFPLRQHVTLDPLFGRFGSVESVLSSSRAHIRFSIEARKAKKSEKGSFVELCS